jgi:hypothetical protein
MFVLELVFMFCFSIPQFKIYKFHNYLWRARRHNGLCAGDRSAPFPARRVKDFLGRRGFRKIVLLKNAAEQKTFLLLLFFLGKKRRRLKTKSATKNKNWELGIRN